MTSTELIACKLFGWRQDDSQNKSPEKYREYVKNSAFGYRHAASVCIESGDEYLGSIYWPNFSDERLQWYWIRRMEDALWERSKDLYREYVHLLHMSIPADERSDNRIDPMRSTVEQRVAAAVKVLEENA